MNDQIDALDALLKDPGWLLFETAQKKQWQDELSNAIAAAANKTDDSLAIGQIRQIVAAQQAVLRALEWPREQVARLKAQAQTAHRVQGMARGGF